MLDSFLRQVTKDSYGPVSFEEGGSKTVVVQKFHEAFSVLNWGKMPDPLLDRGRINAFVFALMNEKLLSAEAWKSFVRSPQALAFRKAGASIQQSGNVSGTLNELAESFPLRSSYVGAIDETKFKALDSKQSLKRSDLLPSDAVTQLNLAQLGDAKIPFLYPVCEFIAEDKAPVSTVMGRAVWDYSIWKTRSGAKVLPFDFLCHFTLTENSLKKLKVDSVSLPKTASLHTLQAGITWDFPVIELTLPHDPFERRLGLSDALWITQFSPDALQKTMLRAAWVAAFVRNSIKNLQLNSVKLRFAIDSAGELMLHDCLALDDLHLEKEGRSLHSDASLEFYQKTSWFENVAHASAHALTFGMSDWKKQVAEPAPFLDAKLKAKMEHDLQDTAKQFLGN